MIVYSDRFGNIHYARYDFGFDPITIGAVASMVPSVLSFISPKPPAPPYIPPPPPPVSPLVWVGVGLGALVAGGLLFKAMKP